MGTIEGNETGMVENFVCFAKFWSAFLCSLRLRCPITTGKSLTESSKKGLHDSSHM